MAEVLTAITMIILFCVAYKYRKWLYGIAYFLLGCGLIVEIYQGEADGIKTAVSLLVFLIVLTVIIEAVTRLFKGKIVKGKKDYDNLSGLEFENYVAELLKVNGFRNVKVTQASGDYGIDILAEKDFKKYAIQCKRYSGNVGNKAVQEAFSGKSFYDADIAVVVTNQKFTKNAVTTAQKLGVQLWDREVIEKMRKG